MSVTHARERVLAWPAREIASQGISRRVILELAGVTSQQLSHFAAGRLSQISRAARRRIESALVALGLDGGSAALRRERKILRNLKAYRAFHAAAIRTMEPSLGGMTQAQMRAHILATEVMP